MTNLPSSTSLVNSNEFEQLTNDAQRVADLFAGATALLTGECSARAVHTARETLQEARGYVSALVQALEGVAARKADADRAMQAHRTDSARAARAVAP